MSRRNFKSKFTYRTRSNIESTLKERIMEYINSLWRVYLWDGWCEQNAGRPYLYLTELIPALDCTDKYWYDLLNDEEWYRYISNAVRDLTSHSRKLIKEKIGRYVALRPIWSERDKEILALGMEYSERMLVFNICDYILNSDRYSYPFRPWGYPHQYYDDSPKEKESIEYINALNKDILKVSEKYSVAEHIVRRMWENLILLEEKICEDLTNLQKGEYKTIVHPSTINLARHFRDIFKM